MPPIDRQYAFRFFYGRTMLSIPEDEAFAEICGGLLKIAQANGDQIEASVDGGWNGSVSKVVDNAVVGYVLAHAARRQTARDRRTGRT